MEPNLQKIVLPGFRSSLPLQASPLARVDSETSSLLLGIVSGLLLDGMLEAR